jgi:1-aminocyclopropane-1-carboxylate deaminase/D-cysteine desulfhydrase-like pyridoxal-dependent ACC family enzyme
MNIGFFVRHFTERGTEVAIYDYAKYNEEILHNKSYIICFNEQTQERIGFPKQRYSYDKFSKRFQIIEINEMNDMTDIIKNFELDFFYTQTHGGNDIYQFNNKDIWRECKTIKHCVFDTKYPESDFYISISQILNQNNNTDLPVIPYIVDLPNTDENLRKELQIPNDAIVFGRHGGVDQFDINITHNAIKQYLQQHENSYFLFMNTNKFYEHPRIIYLDKNLDLYYKVKFINTCDAMIHARGMGETFGLSIAEFSIKNKPVITCNCGDLEHIRILGDKAVIYSSSEQLMDIFKNIKTVIHSRDDWNAYRLYTPTYVMNLFKTIVFEKK